MKRYQGALIAGLMALGLAACSSTDMNTGANGVKAPADTANATDRTNGSNGGGADNSAGNNAGTGNSGVAPTGR